METTVLHTAQLEQKIIRIAHEILEHCFEESRLIIVGVAGNGLILANRIAEVIRANSTQEIEVVQVEMDKDNPLGSPISLGMQLEQLDGQTVILVDDVINSGRTMQYGLMKILERPVKSVKTVALVDRLHRRFPIRADFVGVTLSTTLKDRVEVSFDGEPQAYLI
jgi:pyrimidine operon attenuation protein / uracil phosphoribosyltransferase